MNLASSASKMELGGHSGRIDPLAADERINRDYRESSRKWLKCMMGCGIDENKKITRLDCVHFICSDQCVAKLKKETKSGSRLKCKQCSRVIESNQLSVKIIPKDTFVKKKDTADVTLVCDHCVWNRPAIAYCQECPSCLCKPCKELHPQTRATVKHKITDNLADYKAKQLAKLKEDESKCKTHNKPCTSHCKSCNARICEMCLSAHEGHITFHIETVKKKLRFQIDLARMLSEKYGLATLDIERKRKEIFDTEWDNVMRLINDQFTAMLTILREREYTLKQEARTRFIKQLGALNMRMACAKLSKSSSEHFIEVGEDIFNNGEDVACYNFLEEYNMYANWQSDMETQMTIHFDRYVDKNWHFTLDTSAIVEAQKYLSEYCQVEYKLKQGEEISTKASASTSKTTPVSSSSLPNAVKGGASGKVDNTETKKTPSRRIAVKSTGAPQNTARNSITTKVTPPVEEKNDNSKLSRASGRMKRKTIDPEDVATESDDDEYFPSRMTRSKLEKMQQIGETRNVDAMDEVQQSNNESELVEVVSNCDAQTEIVESSLSDDVASASSKVNRTNGSTLSTTNKRLENEKENLNGNDAKEASASRSEVPIDAALQRPDARITSAVDKSPTKVKPDGASPDSSVSESSERGLGKRERKKKEFPEFVDTDKSIKMLRKQTAEALASTTRMRRKSGKLGALKNSGLLPHEQVVMKAEAVANENSARQMEDADPNCNSETENGHDYDSGDDCGSETSTRRHSLRRRAAPAADTPESANKRPRTSSSVEEHTFPPAPLTSFEGNPDLNDYPIQGQGRMKISNVDENDDYCCVCLDGGEEVIVCCDFCPKVFHLNCHIPVIKDIPEGEAKWRCNYETTKETVDALIAHHPDVPGSEQASLDESNPRHFIRACKFVMEFYKIPESPTMRYLFPEGYLARLGKVPFNLKYIRERLCLGMPTRFIGVREMLLAFQQMFIQASIFYKKIARKPRNKEAASNCFEKFLDLVDEYYPEYRHLYTAIEY